MTFQSDDDHAVQKRDTDLKDDTLDITTKTTQSPDAWKDQAADLNLRFLDSNLEGSGYASDAPYDDSDLEGSGAPKIFLKSDAQINQADQANQFNGTSSSPSSYPPNFATALQQDGAQMTFSVVDGSLAKDNGSLDYQVGSILGYLDRASNATVDKEVGDDIITLWINLKTGKIVGSTLKSLKGADNILKVLLGTDDVEMVVQRYGWGGNNKLMSPVSMTTAFFLILFYSCKLQWC